MGLKASYTIKELTSTKLVMSINIPGIGSSQSEYKKIIE